MILKEKKILERSNDKKIDKVYRELLNKYSNIECNHEMYLNGELPNNRFYYNYIRRLTSSFKELRSHPTLQKQDIISSLEPIMEKMNNHR